MAREECQVVDSEATFSAEVIPDGRVRLGIEHRHGEVAVALAVEDAERIAWAILDVVESAARPESPSGAQPKPKRKRRLSGGEG
jgi:hypothetical protein